MSQLSFRATIQFIIIKTICVLVLAVIVSGCCFAVIPYLFLGAAGTVSSFWALWIVVWGILLVAFLLSIVGAVGCAVCLTIVHIWGKFHGKN